MRPVEIEKKRKNIKGVVVENGREFWDMTLVSVGN